MLCIYIYIYVCVSYIILRYHDIMVILGILMVDMVDTSIVHGDL